jgi:hypothetical protein
VSAEERTIMAKTRRIYFYKLTTDDGGAPCVTKEDRLLSLAICKPMIRGTAEEGDLIFGFAAKSLNRENRLIYIAEVTRKVTKGDYFREKRFSKREDCVYEWRDGRFEWRRGAAHHESDDLVHDLGACPDYPKANVLLSTDFRYFGGKGTSEYKRKYPLVKGAVEGLRRGHRVWHDEELREQLLRLKAEAWRSTPEMVAGTPTSARRCNACHRSSSSGAVDGPEDP